VVPAAKDGNGKGPKKKGRRLEPYDKGIIRGAHSVRETTGGGEEKGKFPYLEKFIKAEKTREKCLRGRDAVSRVQHQACPSRGERGTRQKAGH